VSTQLDLRVPEELVNPLDGELVKTSDLAAVGDALDRLKEHKRQVDAVIAQFTDAVVLESRRQGSKTLHAGGMELKVSADNEVVWDVTILPELLERGLPQDRYDELVTVEVTHKVNAAVANQIAGANPEFAEVIARAKGRRPKRQYVTPTRRA
jgi:hypothetical protein